jgi:UDP-N-acetylmuramoyl-L-alanyl-D-glutamate--2,6-diaminopimelate ligase
MNKDLLKFVKSARGVTDDSRKVKKGYIFVAIKGRTSDGHDFIDEAIKNGAAVIVGEKNLNPDDVTYLKVSDSRDALGEIASEFYGRPSEHLTVIGVTGTKGKTTTCHLIYHILTSLGKKTGLVSSIMAKIGSQEIDTGFHVTSPDVVSLHKFLAEMVEKGCKYAVIEVSSHGIDQKRIAGVKFDLGVLTNIAPEHLDYHKTFKEYKRVKMSFLNSAKKKVMAPKFTELRVLPGEFNNLDAEVALMAVEKLGIDRKLAFKTLETFRLPEGRLTEVKNDLGIKIYIDFAHTPESLEALLEYLRTITSGKLISVFGCAGERDHKKRRKMGRISWKLADLSVFTAEDPRTENIFDILRMMKKDLPADRQGLDYVTIPERGEAIAYALSVARKGDTVVFAGKGHEKSMSYDGWEHPWSDLESVKNFLRRKKDVSAIVLAAGKGTRMKSGLPKVLHKICGRPMITYSLQHLRDAGVGEIIVVVSFKKNLVIRQIQGAVKIAIQKDPKGGTADAAYSGLQHVSKEAKYVMVLYGDDTAFYSSETINKVLENHKNEGATLSFVSLIKDDPHGLGRIVRDKKGNLKGIVEEKDATEEERKIKEINDGLYVFDRKWLERNLPKVEKSPISGEYYIVELIKIAIDQGKKTIAYTLPNSIEWQGINTPEELALAERKMEEKLK